MEHPVCRLDDIPPGRGWPARVAGVRIAVFRHGEDVFAVSNTCLHNEYPIDDGAIEDGCVVCPWHGWRFELATGDHIVGGDGPDALFPRFNRPGLASYPARVERGMVLVRVEPAEAGPGER